jgi:hypothetical protein
MNLVNFHVEVLGVIVPVQLLVRRAHGESRQVDPIDFRRIFYIEKGPEPFLA